MSIAIWNVKLEEITKFVPTSILRTSPRSQHMLNFTVSLVKLHQLSNTNNTSFGKIKICNYTKEGVVLGRSLAGIVGTNPAEVMDVVCFVGDACCDGLIIRVEETYRL